MKIKGKILDVSYDYMTNKPKILFQANQQLDILTEEFNNLVKIDNIEIEIKKESKRRSLDANAYCWVLMQEIATKIGSTKEEVYRKYIRERGIFRIITINEEAVDTFIKVWNDKGLGWICETYDNNITGLKNVYAYYGTSSYNKKQMSDFLTYITDEARELGIQIKSKIELEEMTEKWN